jgi:hypothetical protein
MGLDCAINLARFQHRPVIATGPPVPVARKRVFAISAILRSSLLARLFAKGLLQIIMLESRRHAVNFGSAQSVAGRFLAPQRHRLSHFF